MSQVNLLPPEVRQKVTSRNQAIAIGIAGAAVVGLLIVFYLLQGVALSQAQSDVAAQEAINAGLQGQVNDLVPYQELENQLVAQQEMVDTAMAGEVAWSGVLRDLQLVLPDQVSLISFGGTAAATAAEGTTVEGGSTVVGNLTMAGESVGSLRVARLLSGITEVRGWENPWTSGLTAGDADRWTWSVTVDMMSDVVTERGSGGTSSAG
jgi:hypothetical protein